MQKFHSYVLEWGSSENNFLKHEHALMKVVRELDAHLEPIMLDLAEKVEGGVLDFAAYLIQCFHRCECQILPVDNECSAFWSHCNCLFVFVQYLPIRKS